MSTPAHSPPDLPVAESHEVTNALYGAPGVRANGLIWYWQLDTPTQIQEWITLTADGTRIEIALDGDAVGLATQLDWRAYGGETRVLAWAACHEPLIDLMRAVFQRDWLPECIGDCDAPLRPENVRAGFAVFRTDGAFVVSGIASFNASWVRALATKAGSGEPRPHAFLRAAVTAQLPVQIDDVEAAPSELDSLAPGAIVRLDNRTLAGDTARVLVIAGHARLIADLTGARATVIGFAPTPAPTTNHAAAAESGSHHGATTHDSVGEPAMPDTLTTATVAPNRTAQSITVPVRLTFTAGAVTLPFGEVSNIGAGYVFELQKRLDDQAITVHANDVPVAVGELVTVGDLIGVRITRLLPQP